MPAVNAGDRSRVNSTAALIALVVVLATGVALRLVWLDDMEYKADEAWTWQHATAAGHTEPFSWVGMPTSAGPENPGMSLWAFLPLAWLSDDPVDMARGVAWLSIVSLGVLVLFAYKGVPSDEREIWLWCAALSAVNPISVLHDRKIWPNSLFPLLVTLFLVCWRRRDLRACAFCWGVLGSFLTQINLSTGFFAAGFVLWAWFADHSRVAWKSWFAGSCLASWPLIPWCHFVLTKSTQPRVTTFKWARMLEWKFLLRWCTEPLGWGLDHALGDDYLDFLQQPVVSGVPSWLVAILHGLALGMGLAIGYRWLTRWRSAGRGWRAALFPTDSFAGLVCNAGFWGYGVLLTLSCLPIHRHYMIAVYTIELLWVANAALHVHRENPQGLRVGRKLLAGLVVLQLMISVNFLGYVHVKQDIRGDYGLTFNEQRIHARLANQSGSSLLRR